jgi:hypothetical protein
MTRMIVVIDGHLQVVLTVGDLAVKRNVLNVDVAVAVDGLCHASKKGGDVSLACSGRI